MPDEPTLGEVARRLADVHADLKEDLHQLATRLDGKVSTDVFELRLKALERDIATASARVTDIERARAEEHRQQDQERRHSEQRRQTDRRLAFSALVAPVLLLLLQTYLATRGAAV